MLYCHFDVEADGRDVLFSSMISLGVCFTNNKGEELGSFLGDIQPLEGHFTDESTMLWWTSDPDRKKELERIRKNAKPVLQVMKSLSTILSKFQEIGYKNFKWIAKPASYDWSWLNAYYNMYLRSLTPTEKEGVVRLHFRAICMSTMRDVYMSSELFSDNFHEKRCNFYKWAQGFQITHNPLDDCRCQSKQYFGLCKELQIPI